MILLNPKLAEGLDSKPALLAALQTALKLEHATIPVYLQAAWSLSAPTDGSDDGNAVIRELINDVAIEEMLHMTLVANLINALGGAPKMNTADFLMSFPGPLPGAVQTGLAVHLRPFSLDQVRDVFLEIEEPEEPQVFPFAAEKALQNLTIGQFYARVRKVLAEGDPAVLFTGDPALQVPRRIGDDMAFVITGRDEALRAIDVIVEQGEGTAQSPLEATGEPSHYYRFQSILHGRLLRADASVAQGFSYSGDPIPFDQARVIPVKPDIRVADLAGFPEALAAATAFNQGYTAMLADLHAAFNGQRPRLQTAVNFMRNTMRTLGEQAMRHPIGGGLFAGPTWEYDATAPLL